MVARPTSTLRKKSFCTSSARIDGKVSDAMRLSWPSSAAAASSNVAGSSALIAQPYWRICSRPIDEGVGIVVDHPQDVRIEWHAYASFAVAMARPKIFFPPVVADSAMVIDFDLGLNGFHPTIEHDFGADAVVGNRHHGGEPDVVLGDRGRVADPRGHVAAAEAHGQHAVRDRGVQADLLGDLVVPVDRVEVTGHARRSSTRSPRVSGMTLSGSTSPTLTELNSRSAIGKALSAVV